MPDEIEDGLLAQIQPVFPQFSDQFVRKAIAVVRKRRTETVQGQTLTVASLLPTCIDYLLDEPQEALIDWELNSINETGYNGLSDNRIEYAGVTEGTVANLGTNERARRNGVANGKRFDDRLEDLFDGSDSIIGSDDSSSCLEGLERPEFNLNRREPEIISRSSSSSSSSRSSSPSSSNDSSLKSSPFGRDRDDQFSNENKKNKSNDKVANRSYIKKGNIVILEVDKPLNKVREIPNVDAIKEAWNTVITIVPDVQETFALKYLKDIAPSNNHQPAYMANMMVEYLFEHKDYPKKEETGKTKTPELKNEMVEDEIDYYKADYLNNDRGDIFYQQCLFMLQQKFRMITSNDIKKAFHKNCSRYARTYKYIMDRQIAAQQGKEKPLNYLRHPRHIQKIPCVLHDVLEKEIKFIDAEERKLSEAADHKVALSLNVKQYEEEGQFIECGCCFGEVVFENMIQCIEGHLFCAECLRSYAKEAIYGAGKMQLSCMTDGCTSSFPLSQLKQALNENMIEKYQERLQEESLNMVELPDLVRCPSCDYAAEMPADDKVFKCQNLECMKETCRYCKEPWRDHFGIPCNEVEKKDQTNLRVSYEEKMSMAKIRTCGKCGCGFMKTDGCNKMTCRCGTTMCYICRKSRIGYDHFCNHPRDPGKGCSCCQKCSLWTDPTEDDERAVQELKEEAIREAAKINSSSPQNGTKAVASGKRSLSIGPPEEDQVHKKPKKRKRHRDFYE